MDVVVPGGDRSGVPGVALPQFKARCGEACRYP